MNTPVDNAWLDELRKCRDTHGGRKAADTIGYSTTVVSQVLSGSYKGDMQAVRQKVEGALMGLSVECPVIGELPRNRCLDYQRQAFSAANPMRVRLAQACPTCPNRRGGNPQ
jgi:hypothetical protein